MFTGIVEEVGRIAAIRKGPHSCTLTIAAANVLEDVCLGDSIATNGVCLTVTNFTRSTFSADVMHETLKLECPATGKSREFRARYACRRSIRRAHRIGSY